MTKNKQNKSEGTQAFKAVHDAFNSLSTQQSNMQSSQKTMNKKYVTTIPTNTRYIMRLSSEYMSPKQVFIRQNKITPQQQEENERIIEKLKKKAKKKEKETLIRKTELGQNQRIFTAEELAKLRLIDQYKMQGLEYGKEKEIEAEIEKSLLRGDYGHDTEGAALTGFKEKAFFEKYKRLSTQDSSKSQIQRFLDWSAGSQKMFEKAGQQKENINRQNVNENDSLSSVFNGVAKQLLLQNNSPFLSLLKSNMAQSISAKSKKGPKNKTLKFQKRERSPSQQSLCSPSLQFNASVHSGLHPPHQNSHLSLNHKTSFSTSHGNAVLTASSFNITQQMGKQLSSIKSNYNKSPPKNTIRNSHNQLHRQSMLSKTNKKGVFSNSNNFSFLQSVQQEQSHEFLLSSLNSNYYNSQIENSQVSKKERLQQIMLRVNRYIEEEYGNNQKYVYMTEERKQAIYECELLRRIKNELGPKFYANLQLKINGYSNSQLSGKGNGEVQGSQNDIDDIFDAFGPYSNRNNQNQFSQGQLSQNNRYFTADSVGSPTKKKSSYNSKKNPLTTQRSNMMNEEGTQGYNSFEQQYYGGGKQNNSVRPSGTFINSSQYSQFSSHHQLIASKAEKVLKKNYDRIKDERKRVIHKMMC